MWLQKCLTTIAITVSYTAFALAESWTSPGPVYWQTSFGIGANQRAELVFDNGLCTGPALISVVTTDQQGTTVVHEIIHVEQSGGAVYPIPASAEERTYFGLAVDVEPETCSKALQTALAIINSDNSTATVNHRSIWSDHNLHDPGIAASAVGVDRRILIAPGRVGPGQSAEFDFWNQCPYEVSVQLRVSDIRTGVERVLSLDVEPSQIGHLGVAVAGAEQAVVMRGFGTFVVKKRPSSVSSHCPPGQDLFKLGWSLVDEQGNTVVRGLPTGKRQHKPVN
jgi:hypothetical protein